MDLIKQLEQTKTETIEFFALSDEELNTSYAPGKWSVRFILHHLADAEMVLFDRIRRVISEPRQVIWAFDQDAWANNLNYAQRPLELSKQMYSAARNGIIYYVGVHYGKDGECEFVHSETGLRTLNDEFEKVARHNQNHIDQIRQALQPRF